MPKLKKAFTLIELLIVVLIISIGYGLVVSNMTKPKLEAQTTLLTLQKTLQKIKNTSLASNVKVECKGDDCENCKIFIDTEEQEDEISLFTDKPKLFSFDKFGYLEEKNDNSGVCFSYNIYKNNSFDKMFLEHKEEFYIFYPFIKKTEKFTDFDEAKKMYDPKEILPTENNQYYAF